MKLKIMVIIGLLILIVLVAECKPKQTIQEFKNNCEASRGTIVAISASSGFGVGCDCSIEGEEIVAYNEGKIFNGCGFAY